MSNLATLPEWGILALLLAYRLLAAPLRVWLGDKVRQRLGASQHEVAAWSLKHDARGNWRDPERTEQEQPPTREPPPEHDRLR